MQGYSEPGSGSDLASLQTRAVRDGDEYVINGQKIWTSGAHHADWIHVLTRTDPDAPKHRGISYFMLDMKTPGVTVRPLIQMHDVHSFNETFFEDVRVPAANIIGEENRGWYVATTTLDFERSGVGRAAGVDRAFQRLRAHVADGDSGVEPSNVQRHALVESAIEIAISRLLGYRVAWMQSKSLVPNYEASMGKAFGSELSQRNARRGINVLGLCGPVAATVRSCGDERAVLPALHVDRLIDDRRGHERDSAQHHRNPWAGAAARLTPRRHES